MKNCYCYTTLLILAIFLQFNCTSNSQHITLEDLRCEYLENPTNIDLPSPRLSWKLKPKNAQSRDITQSAYQVIVASTLDLLQQDQGDLWESGKVYSDQSVLIPYQGNPLNSRQSCFWKVRIWDQQDKVTAWSAPAQWQMALLEEADWIGAKWIGLREDSIQSVSQVPRLMKTDRMDAAIPKKSYPSPWLRKEIVLDQKIKNAKAYISGLGYFELYVNGKKVGNQVLDPGQTSYDKHALYVTHDISDLLKIGGNALGIWLGNGFYGQNIAFSTALQYGQPRVKAKFFLEYDDGRLETIGTDEDWKTHPSAIVFDNVYGGETYDARLEIDNWHQAGYDDASWPNAVLLDNPGPETRLRSQLIPPIKVTKRLKPKTITATSEGKYLIDFGQNIAGWVKIKVQEPEGTVIKIKSGEAITADKMEINTESTGHFATGLIQELHYLAKGEGVETWEPRFTYHGFRYVEISGLSQPPSPASIEGVLVHSDLPRLGTFSCSDPLLNKLYKTSIWTFVDNWHSIPEDCPHREKCGWLGDAHAAAEASLFSFDMGRFFTKYMLDIEDNLAVNKAVKAVLPESAGVPTMVAPGKRAIRPAALDWGVAVVLVPWYLYLHHGDLSLFERHYAHMQDFITYMYSFLKEDGTINNGLGDWCPPRWDRQNAPEFMECHPNISANAYFYQALRVLAEMAPKLGDPEYGVWCAKKAEEIKAAFNRAYLQNIEGTDLQHYGSQTATVMALQLGMVPEDQKEQVVQALIYDINQLHNGHHSTGIHGLRYIYSVLSETGHEDLAYHMLTDTTFPSPGYIVNCGLTTWPERQWEWDKLPEWERSLNHPMQGGFSAFMHEGIGGIRPSSQKAGYQKISLKPYLTDELEWAKAHLESPYGMIKSEWESQENRWEWAVEIPPNTRATVHLPTPTNGNQTVLEDGQIINDLLSTIRIGNKDWSSYEIGSGSYHFIIQP